MPCGVFFNIKKVIFSEKMLHSVKKIQNELKIL